MTGKEWVTKRLCSKCGSIMYLNKKLNIWECSSCGRRLGAWITKYTA